MKAFLEAIENNPELKAKVELLNKTPDTTTTDYIQLAKEYGFELPEDAFKPAVKSGEVSDDELDAVVGGKKCQCIVGGGGSAGGSNSPDDGTCACVGFGAGMYEYYYGHYERCFCVGLGTGSEGSTCGGQNGWL